MRINLMSCSRMHDCRIGWIHLHSDTTARYLLHVDVVSARKPDILMPRVKGVSDLHYRNGYAMIAFITEIQEPTDNRG